MAARSRQRTRAHRRSKVGSSHGFARSPSFSSSPSKREPALLLTPSPQPRATSARATSPLATSPEQPHPGQAARLRSHPTVQESDAVGRNPPCPAPLGLGGEPKATYSISLRRKSLDSGRCRTKDRSSFQSVAGHRPTPAAVVVPALACGKVSHARMRRSPAVSVARTFAARSDRFRLQTSSRSCSLGTQDVLLPTTLGGRPRRKAPVFTRQEQLRPTP